LNTTKADPSLKNLLSKGYIPAFYSVVSGASARAIAQLKKFSFPAKKILPLAQLKYPFWQHFLYAALYSKALHQSVKLFLSKVKNLSGSTWPSVPSVFYPFICQNKSVAFPYQRLDLAAVSSAEKKQDILLPTQSTERAEFLDA